MDLIDLFLGTSRLTHVTRCMRSLVAPSCVDAARLDHELSGSRRVPVLLCPATRRLALDQPLSHLDASFVGENWDGGGGTFWAHGNDAWIAGLARSVLMPASAEIQFRVRALACVLALDSRPAFTWVGSTNDFSFCRGGRIRRDATLAVRSRGEAYFFFLLLSIFFFSLFDIILIWKFYCPKKVINIT